ncbi:MAG: SprB repeat-containing protein [Bacteroidota bacterium]
MRTFRFLLAVTAGLCLHTPGNAQEACSGFRTYPQGVWGANPVKNNPAAWLEEEFNAAFPGGIEIGCKDALDLMSPEAVRKFLPQGGVAAELPFGLLTDPDNEGYNNVLAGHLVALTINVGFDLHDPGFSPSDQTLAELLISEGPFKGFSVERFLERANQRIGGCIDDSLSLRTYSQVAATINRSYTDGILRDEFLICPVQVRGEATAVRCPGGSDGTVRLQVEGGVGPFSFHWNNGQDSRDMEGVIAGEYMVTVTDISLGASVEKRFTIDQPAPTEIKAAVNPTTGGYTVSMTGTGGSGPYTFIWEDGNKSNPRSPMAPGVYRLSAYDARQCRTHTTVEVKESALVSLPNAVVRP